MIARTTLGFAILLMIGPSSGARAQMQLSGSEALRAETCAGDYTCDDDGSWAIGDICAEQRAAIVAVEEARSRQASTDRPAASDRVEQVARRD
ncbi:MAG: hypothetical protein IT537_00410 [Hyphomicrobiales bacterium]|nr:hypothetical protein [Hyphomicrobiales bacterium]